MQAASSFTPVILPIFSSCSSCYSVYSIRNVNAAFTILLRHCITHCIYTRSVCPSVQSGDEVSTGND